MTSIKQFLFLEISLENEKTNFYITKTQSIIKEIIINFKFTSKKSLILFLKNYKDEIIGNVQGEELEHLENQDFLEYLNWKWYTTDTEKIKKLITPEEILDIGIKYKIFDENEILKYMLSETHNYRYEFLQVY